MSSVLLLDVDGTLAQFNNSAGAEKVAEILVKLVGSKGKRAGDDFFKIYQAINSTHHGKKSQEYAAVVDALNSYSVKLPPELEQREMNFMWSRELWLKYISEMHKLNLPWNRIVEIADCYWKAASLHSPLYSEVKGCLEKLVKNNSRLFLITASDNRFTFTNRTITYDPKVSEQKKIKRILEQGFSGIFKPRQIITGDPFNKPSPEFWQKCVKVAGLTNLSEAVVIDDTKDVVLSAINFGFKGCVLDRAGHYNSAEIKRAGAGYITKLEQLNQ